MRRCSACQEENVDDAIFCSGCGTSLEPGLVAAMATDVQREIVTSQPSVLSESPTPQAPWTGAACALVVCTLCGSINALDATFCGNCGSHIGPSEPDTSVAESAPPTVEPVSTAGIAASLVATPAADPPPPEHPRLVVADSGMYFDISGRNELIIGRVDPISQVFPEIDLTPHGGDEAGVSRKHCRITLAGNQFFVEDLHSSNGTWLGAERLSPGVRTALNNGDQLRVGKLRLNFFSGCV